MNKKGRSSRREFGLARAHNLSVQRVWILIRLIGKIELNLD